MKITGKTALMLAAAALLLAAGSASRATEADPYEGMDAATREKLKEWDNGPDKIDVSGYPEEIRKLYPKFAFKCSKCHTLARPINCDLALPDEWREYVKKMATKRRSGIHKSDIEAISKFLSYDSSARKKELVERKLKALKAGEAPKDEPARKPKAEEKSED